MAAEPLNGVFWECSSTRPRRRLLKETALVAAPSPKRLNGKFNGNSVVEKRNGREKTKEKTQRSFCF